MIACPAASSFLSRLPADCKLWPAGTDRPRDNASSAGSGKDAIALHHHLCTAF